MSSWGASTKTQMKKKPDGYFFQPTLQDICSYFNDYFEACDYAKQKHKSLFVQETNLEPGYKVLQQTFRAPPFVEFVDLPNPYYMPLPNERKSNSENPREFAKEVFSLRNDVQSTLQILNASLPSTFDVGIYIDPIKHLPTDHYISLLHKLTKGAELHIFIMSINVKAVEEFREAITQYQLPWVLYHCDLQVPKTTSKKIKTIEFLAELEIMKHARIVVCGASTPIGKFLYRTCDYVDNFIGVEPK